MYEAELSYEFKWWRSEHHLLKIKCPQWWLAYKYTNVFNSKMEHKLSLMLFLIILEKLRSQGINFNQ